MTQDSSRSVVPLTSSIWHRGASHARAAGDGRLTVVGDVIEPDDESHGDAKLAADVLFGHVALLSAPGRAKQGLLGALERANAALFDPVADSRSIFAQAGAVSIAALLVSGPRVSLAVIGSCRCFRTRRGQTECLHAGHSTEDPMSPGSATNANGRGLVSEALGLRERIRPSFAVHDACVGDRYLLCTPAVWSSVSAGELHAVMTSGQLAEQAQHELRARVPPDHPHGALAIVQVDVVSEEPWHERDTRNP